MSSPGNALRATSKNRLYDTVCDEGACVDTDAPPFWFAAEGANASFFEAQNRGLLFCSVCPVTDECLRFAQLAEMSDGVWDGVELNRGSQAEELVRRPAELAVARNRLRYRAVRWLARTRFEKRRGRPPTRNTGDVTMLRQIEKDVEAVLAEGRVPEDVLEEIRTYVPPPEMVDSDLPAELIAWAEERWAERIA